MSNRIKNLSQLERGISIAAGALLTLAGMRRSTVGITLTALGCALAYRGLSGHCPVYEQLGIGDGVKEQLDHCVDVTADESFPASDPPAWVGGRN